MSISAAPAGARAVLRAPHVRTVLLAAQVGRIPQASAPLALLLFGRQTLSLATAGLLVAGYTAGMAAGTPLLARAVDRRSQPPVVLFASLLSAAGFLLVAAGTGGTGVLLAGAVVAGLGTPPLEACLRVLWPAMVPPAAVAAAYALDIAFQEVIFVVGPLVTLAAVALAGPAAGLIAAAVLQLAGSAVYARTPVARRWRGETAARHWSGPLRVPQFVLLSGGIACVGAAVGSLPVALTGYAEALSDRSLSGWLLACQAVGALIGGLLYTRARRGGRRRLPLITIAFAAGYLPLLLMPGAVAMAPLTALCGLALPPLLTVAFLSADALAPAGTVVEAFAWIATAFAIGSAAGSALTGPLVDSGLRLGFGFAPVAGLLAILLMSAAARK
ncbi:MFS transporter [Actinoplanes sp. NPDC051411]|uniref:MFS transporter n=1 Tax=Actinoplanes sp. NPDC051411 TaxID=3155522 RepID=UPI0034434023